MKKNIKYLIEKHINFNVTDYSEDEDNLLSSHEIENIIIRPKDRDELCRIICERYEKNPEYPYLLDIDTSEITDMSGVFCPIINTDIIPGNPYLNNHRSYKNNLMIKVLDLSTWETSNVRDMSYMFWACGEKHIDKINIKNFNTSNVTNMQGMFGFCNNLSRLDLSSFDTSCVLNMENMFDNCESLKELDLSNFDTSKVVTMARMFRDCHSLVTLNINGWNMSNIENVNYMFSNCYKLTNIDFSNFNIDIDNIRDGLWGTFSGSDALRLKYDMSRYLNNK